MEEKEKEMELTSTPSNSTGGTGHMAEYQSNIKLFDEIENFLLGSFDKSGKYSLSQEMVDELIKMDKIYSYAFGEVVFCESETFFENVGHIQFTVKIEQNKKDMVAKLMLVQEVKRANGMLKKNAVTELLTYQAVNSPSFVNDCFEKFNIHSKKEDGLQKKEFENEEVSVVRERLKYLNGKRMLLDEKDALFKELVEKKLALLAKYGVGKKILAEYNAMIQKGRFNKLAKGYYRHLNSILDNIMEKNKAELLKDPFFVAQWGKLNANISSKIKKEVNNPLKLTQSDKEKMAVKEASEKEKEKLKEDKKKPTANKSPKPNVPKYPKPPKPISGPGGGQKGGKHKPDHFNGHGPKLSFWSKNYDNEPNSRFAKKGNDWENELHKKGPRNFNENEENSDNLKRIKDPAKPQEEYENKDEPSVKSILQMGEIPTDAVGPIFDSNEPDKSPKPSNKENVIIVQSETKDEEMTLENTFGG